MRAPYTDVEYACSNISSGGLLPATDRPTAAVIDLEALSHNYGEVTRRIGGRKVLAVVKAQAYGHGAVAVSRRLVELGADMLAVALVEEGKELRDAGIAVPIVVMGPVRPEQAGVLARSGLTPVVFTPPVAKALSAAAAGAKIPVHVKVDTGMGRIGLTPEDALPFILSLAKMPGIVLEGIMTHFADADLKDKGFATAQMDRFEALVRSLEEQGISIPLRHAANSASVLEYDRALLTMVRPGLMLYGYDPLERRGGCDLRPVLSLVSSIAYLKKVPAGVPISYGRTFVTKRESLIATVPIGYADGYSRGLSSQGEALVRGMRVPVAGRVCMDMTMLDVTDVAAVAEGDSVVLIGCQGSERISADELAVKTGTISYEVLCGISSRVPRLVR